MVSHGEDVRRVPVAILKVAVHPLATETVAGWSSFPERIELHVKRLPHWLLDALGPTDAVHAVFEQQDSGCVSFGVTQAGTRFFVKTATTAKARAGLDRASALHGAVRHPTIVRPVSKFCSQHGMALVYPWVEGQLLYAPQDDRCSRDSAPRRFRELPVSQVCEALDDLFDAHRALAARGFVSSDFYDGSMMYDFDRRKLWLIDLDEYRDRPFTLLDGRAPGSTRFMAPEEYTSGATIDERTTVHHLARAASVLLDEGDDTGIFRGSREQEHVALEGQASDPTARYQSVSAFTRAWRDASR